MFSPSHWIAAAAVASLLTAVAAQQQQASDEPQDSAPRVESPCTSDDSPYRDFDFWVGEWDVFDPDSGRRLGSNTITLRDHGCLIVERWTSVQGGTGMSMNFYDPLKQAWRQVWQSAGAFIDYTGGLDDNGRMVLDGTLHYNAQGESLGFRGRWTPNDDGTVLQEFWQRDPESGEWASWFVGEYRPAGASD
jgi:hypothetical protein